MGDIASHKVPLERLTSLSCQLQSNDPSVSSITTGITDRFQNIQTQAKVLLLKPSTTWFANLLFPIACRLCHTFRQCLCS